MCLREAGHKGRCTDMPFLVHLTASPNKLHRAVAEKIGRDALNTRGAAWPANQKGVQKRRNRQPRWTLKPGDQLFPKHAADYQTCLLVAQILALHVHEMQEAPPYPPDAVKFLPRPPKHGTYLCPVCRVPINFKDFGRAAQSKAVLETAHLDPTMERIHTPGNVRLAHRVCNIAQGDRSIEDFTSWIRGILERAGFLVKPTRGA